MSRKTLTPSGGPPQVGRPDPAIYQAMGQDNIYRMIFDFYHELERSSIRALFPADIDGSAEKSAAFFVGLLGGPPLYHERYGQPMLRQRHMPFPIDRAARDVWIACFKKTLVDAEAKYGFPAAHLAQFTEFLDQFSLWMINTE